MFRAQLRVKDRIARLAKLKAVCLFARGGSGHWAGDPACKFPKQSITSPLEDRRQPAKLQPTRH